METDILVLGGTRFLGKQMVRALLEKGHCVTIATRGLTEDPFGETVKRITLDRTDAASLKEKLAAVPFDVVCDSLAYCSNDVRSLWDSIPWRPRKYVMTSTMSVYEPHLNTAEEDFDPYTHPLNWCNRADFPYNVVKQQAECAVFQAYPDLPTAAVRYPYVVGEDDYTNRLAFYIESIVKQTPASIDNFENRMEFVRSCDAGAFLAFLAENAFKGPINGCSRGGISIREIAEYTERRTGKRILLSGDGAAAPYNGTPPYSLNTQKAEGLGFSFPPLEAWIYDLIDFYIRRYSSTSN